MYWSLFTSSAGLRLDAVASRMLSERAIPQLRVTKGIDEICRDPLLVYYSFVIFSFFSLLNNLYLILRQKRSFWLSLLLLFGVIDF